MPLVTENPLQDISPDQIEAFFNIPPEDLLKDRKSIEEIIRIARTLRGRRLNVEGRKTVEKPAKETSSSAESAVPKEPKKPGRPAKDKGPSLLERMAALSNVAKEESDDGV